MRRHIHIIRALAPALVVLGLGVSQPAFAAPEGHATEEHHGGDHGDAAHGDEAHGDDHGGDHGGEHHHYYTHDDDHDGTPNWLDSDSGETYVALGLLFHFINLLLLFGVIGWAARRPASDFVRSRALGIRKELEDTKAARDAAESAHAEIVERLAKVEQEVADIERKAKEQAATEHAKLVARAHSEAERIGATAERNIRDEVSRARNELRREAVELAVQLAETTLRANVDRSDQQELARQFLESLADKQVNADA